MKHTLSVLVENHAGVLSRVSGLFARRGFNIDSLAVGTTSEPSVSCITIVVDDKENAIEQIEKQLNKLIDVIKVKDFTPTEIISRELMMIKVNATGQTRQEIKELADMYGAKIADITRNSMTIECCNTTERLENLLDIVRPYGLKQVIRTGSIALEKGSEQFSI
ncbi:MAG TPA: acetolactate synthase small subunit [Candidatus Faecivivens stercoripullorum]|uniref:Acetolactate synthase small subunit n=1 Tax=Candidatus Faecivivens stercoripullorum TaxID=2840805 RepID=A0A9D1H5C8_9FIRM|nr:acetolactate synthase small subunit [Candidatus Faecivivens stercorigallinarum]HIT93948.1 acetolactate synthase small subunit [Candidatus Faecivivens stercoripullorum]